MWPDLDGDIEDDEEEIQHVSEKCDIYYEEDIKLLEKQQGQNGENVQR